MASVLCVLVKNERAWKRQMMESFFKQTNQKNLFFFFWEDDIKQRPELNEG